MKTLLAVGLLLASSACTYRETLGRTGGDVPAADASPGCDGSSCGGPVDCASFVIPSGDCTLGRGACTFDSDCTGLNQGCNGATGRCYLATDSCVGTPCRLDTHCASTERCNLTSNTCFELSADQSCMPCFLLSVDCGSQICDNDLEVCL